MKKCLFFLIFSLIFKYNGFAVIYYVNNNSTSGDKWCTAVGDDGNSGLAPALPKATMTNLFNNYTLTAGDIVLVDTGSYSDELKFEPGQNAADDNGSDSGYLVIQGAGITNTTKDGLGTHGWCFRLEGRKSIIIKDMVVKASSGNENILLESCTNCIITNCNVYQAINGRGIAIWKSIGNLVRGCIVGGTSHNDVEGIIIKENSHYNQVLNSSIFLSGQSGIKIENNSDYNILEGNQVYRNNVDNVDWNGGILIVQNGGVCDYNVIRNNLIATNTRFYNVLLENTTKCTLENNTIGYITGGSGSYQCNIRMNNADNCVIRSNMIHNGTYHGI
ncbi:MAG: right-handed parallel beta-helix repeat-containing protein, partial [Spirochaetes bacterium]|nr:right-handed parallel beta-helix repeat-containing protein [Spirochaetota bacterium]